MSLLLKAGVEPAESWIEAFAALDPELEVVVWPDVDEPEAVTAALVAAPPRGLLASLPNLAMIASLPAGLDHLFRDPELPADVPITRSLPPDGDPMMTEFVVLHVLRHHRQLPQYLVQQQRREWKRIIPQPNAAERRVGILGIGTLGRPAAEALVGLGFDVAGWSRTPKQIDGVRSFVGEAEVGSFLERTDILVSMLPTTPSTIGLLDAEAFARLPPGSAVINVGRGPVIDEEALLAALDSGHLSAATLDVFAEEPLSRDSPLWTHERITITPHVASVISPHRAAAVVVENLRRLAAGEPLVNLVDRAAGY
jgi:glyoxylate/hydroxypyruvate reductase A